MIEVSRNHPAWCLAGEIGHRGLEGSISTVLKYRNRVNAAQGDIVNYGQTELYRCR